MNMGFDWAQAPYPQRCNMKADDDSTFVEVARFDAEHANQGVAVDDSYFYAIDNTVITKHDKKNGREVARFTWSGVGKNPLIHLDSGVVLDGKLYTAHSNYSEWPMLSSLEIWDARTLKHIGTHSFGIQWGSLTWVDYHDGAWYAMFANYNAEKPHPDPLNPNGYEDTPRVSVREPYGYKRATVLVKYTRDFQVLESWAMPDELLANARTGDMSISGGSWGPDGSLWITGHDNPEIHKVAFPEIGSKLVLLKTYPLGKDPASNSNEGVSIRGQGIAWDHSQCGFLYGIIRATDEEADKGVSNKVTVLRFSP
jgi:hypothetical protein